MPIRARLRTDRGFQELLRKFPPNATDELRRDIDTSALKAARICQLEMQRLYKEGVPGHRPNHPFTVFMKGSSQPLKETGEMANAVVVFMSRSGQDKKFSVGFPDDKNGMKARNAELGIWIRITPKMRRFLFRHGLWLRRSTRFIRIPPRPVLPTTVERAVPRMSSSITKYLKIQIDKKK